LTKVKIQTNWETHLHGNLLQSQKIGTLVKHVKLVILLLSMLIDFDLIGVFAGLRAEGHC